MIFWEHNKPGQHATQQFLNTSFYQSVYSDPTGDVAPPIVEDTGDGGGGYRKRMREQRRRRMISAAVALITVLDA